ncbi:MAG: hypothetical protein AAGC74_04265 [Verrucomicrobiota bacterium]
MGTCALVLGASELRAHTVVIDLDLSTPGIQSTRSVVRNSTFLAGVVMISDGSTPITSVALATMWNDAPGVLTAVSPTVASGGAGIFGFPSRHVADQTVVVADDPMPSLGLAAFDVGTQGAFQSTDGGVGVYGDFLNTAPLAGELALWRIELRATGALGSSSDVAAFGVIDSGSAATSFVPSVVGSGGVEFFDSGVFGGGGTGAYGATSLGVGTVTVIPEPSVSLLSALCSLGVWARRRR